MNPDDVVFKLDGTSLTDDEIHTLDKNKVIGQHIGASPANIKIDNQNGIITVTIENENADVKKVIAFIKNNVGYRFMVGNKKLFIVYDLDELNPTSIDNKIFDNLKSYVDIDANQFPSDEKRLLMSAYAFVVKEGFNGKNLLRLEYKEKYTKLFNQINEKSSFIKVYFNDKQLENFGKVSNIFFDLLNKNLNKSYILSIGNSLFFPLTLTKMRIMELDMNYNIHDHIYFYPLSKFKPEQVNLNEVNPTSSLSPMYSDMEIRLKNLFVTLVENIDDPDFRLYITDFAGTSGDSLTFFIIVFCDYVYKKNNANLNMLQKCIIPVYAYHENYIFKREIQENIENMLNNFQIKNTFNTPFDTLVDIFNKSVFFDVITLDYLDKNQDLGRCIIQNQMSEMNENAHISEFTGSKLCVLILYTLYVYYHTKLKLLNANKIGTNTSGGSENYYHKYIKYKNKYLESKKIIALGCN